MHPQKLYTKEQLENDTPTRRDNVPKETESQWRRTYCQLIAEVARRLKIPPWSSSTACYFCHRFYTVKSMAKNDPFVIATAALLLASKTEEAPKPLREIVNNVLNYRWGRDPSKQRQIKETQYLEEFKEHVLTAERALLYILQFDLQSTPVHSHFFKAISEGQFFSKIKGTMAEEHYQSLMQTTMNLLNDSFKTTLCLQYPPEQIACASIFLAGHLMKGTSVSLDLEQLWDYFQVHPKDALEICEQLLDLYAGAYTSKEEEGKRQTPGAILALGEGGRPRVDASKVTGGGPNLQRHMAR